MKRGQIAAALLMAALLSVIAYSTYGVLHAGDGEEYRNVSVVLSDSSNEMWAALKEGMEQAAADYYINLDIISTGSWTSAAGELSALQRSQDGEAEGLLIQNLYADASLEILNNLSDSGRELVLMDTGESSSYLFSDVMPDQTALGETLAQAALDHWTGSETPTIGILVRNGTQTSSSARQEGVKNLLAAEGISAEWVTSLSNLAGAAQRRAFMRNHQADIWIALDNDETETAAELLSDGIFPGTVLIGTGTSEKNVYYLDKGYIQELVIPNEYYQGYRSIQILAQQLRTPNMERLHEETEILRVTKDNLFDPELEKIVFPVVR